jgi:chromosome transmission fidelity protein 18
VTQEEKANYGFNVNELFARLEVQKLKQSQSTFNGIKPQKKKHKSYFKNEPKETLWAEKWRPSTFFDFVGNEATNRRILKWLRQWDRVVFEKNFKPITTEDTQANRFSDPFGRPERKVLLISGPPGLGKTTVAHVIAKQAGYEVMEINASDERAGQRVKEKVNNSLTSLTFSGKPVCLVADEVDGGAEFGFIKVLIDLLNDDTKTLKKFQSSESSKFFSQKSKNKPKFLLRPIICICNDVYVSALEKLRPLAEMISFQQASEAALSDRLRFICEAEGIHMTNAQLKEIIHLTDFDIRSCVNLLQFGGGLNTSDDSRKKDFQMTWYGVVNEIFKRSPKVTKSEQFNRVAKLVTANTNLDKVINGCFQAYPDIHFQDTAMSKPAMISDWLFFADRMSHAQFEAIGDLSYYQSQVALQFFNQFSDISNRSNIKIKSDWEYFEKKKQCQNVIKIMYSRLSPQLRSLVSEPDLAVQVLPYLEIIIVPERKSSYQLREKEQQRITAAIEAIQVFGLYLNRAKDSDYNEIFVTYPDFTPVTRFDTTAVRKQQQRQTQVFPTILRQMDTIRAKKRTFKDMEGVPVNTQSNIDELKDQYNKINELEESSKKQKVSVKIWVKYHEGFSNAVRKPVKWQNLWG